MKKLNIFIITILTVITCYSQEKSDALLQEIIEEENDQKRRISKFQNSNHKKVIKNGVIIDIIDGKPVYAVDFNQKAQSATRTNFLKESGGLGLDLNGDGMVIGIWEVGGIPQINHPEFINGNNISRIIVRDEIEESRHATHVAGTLIAKGAKSSVQGMAKNSTAIAYDNIDDKSETLASAANENLLISNHSYGIPISSIVEEGLEWFPGSYSSEARLWDRIANTQPYYLAFFSAGNDGKNEYEGGLGNSYDKLNGNKNSKNMVVVANASLAGIVNSTGELLLADINSTSSQGPTDDRRIKPDITGLGTSIESSVLNNEYGSATGTSMSAPNVAGTSLLLQELYNNLNNKFMLSSSLKALISVTASDAGEVGPDPLFGWGVMNAKRAAEAIMNDIIIEETLNNGDIKIHRIQNNGDNPLRIALAWNDPAGDSAENGVFNDPTPRIINDLDLKISDVSNPNITYFPWKLDIEDVSKPAIKGVNSVDNIEIIEIDSQGLYEIEISHKNEIADGNQVYSLIILNGMQQSLSNEDFNSNSITFWPNPVKNQLNISSSEINFSTDVQVSVYDMLGRKVIDKKDFNSTSGLSIDTSTLSKGIYILNLTDGAQSIQKRIIKE